MPEGPNALGRQILRSGVGSALVKGVSLALSFVVSVVLARTLGPDDYGLYSFVFALATIMAVPAQFGLPGLIMRETGSAIGQGDYARLAGAWRWSGRAALRASGWVVLVGIVGAFALGSAVPVLKTPAYYWALVLVPLVSLGAVRGAALRGLGKTVQGIFPEFILFPGLFLLFFVIAWWFSGKTVNASVAMASQTLSAATAFLLGLVLLHRARPVPLKQNIEPAYDTGSWRKSVLPMAAIMGMGVLVKYTDVVMVGLYLPDDQVGIYRVAAQWSFVVTLGTQVVGLVTPPYFARYHALGDKAGVQRLATQTARVGALLGLPPLLVFVLLGKPFIGFVFGAEYLDAYLPLAILAGGQYVNVLNGSCGILLAMSHLEHASARVMALSALLNVVFNAVLIPIWGLAGAAIATSLALAAQRVVLGRIAWLRLGIVTSPFGGSTR